MRFHQPTIEHVARRTAEGKPKSEIIRCLKRHVAREVMGVPASSAASTAVRATSGPTSIGAFNGLAEKLFVTLECELLDRRPVRTREEARTAIF